jgi:Protein of unknown function (DUF1203)
MAFRITGLSPKPFQHLFGLPDDELAKHGARRCVADEVPGFPCRIEMRDAELGETLLLLNHTCQPADTPYRASHAIFVREGATETYNQMDQVPEVMRRRALSLRAYDAAGMMLDANIEPVIARMFVNSSVEYIHVHNAKRGCYSGRVDRT